MRRLLLVMKTSKARSLACIGFSPALLQRCKWFVGRTDAELPLRLRCHHLAARYPCIIHVPTPRENQSEVLPLPSGTKKEFAVGRWNYMYNRGKTRFRAGSV